MVCRYKISMASPAEWCSLFIWILLHCCGCWAVVLYRNTLSHPNILFSLKQWQPKLSACKLVWLYEMFWPKGRWQTVTVTASSWVSSSPQFSQSLFWQPVFASQLHGCVCVSKEDKTKNSLSAAVWISTCLCRSVVCPPGDICTET